MNDSKKQLDILVLINPNSGRGKSMSIYKRKLKPFLDSRHINYQIFITQPDFRVTDFLKTKSTDDLINLKSILVVSGDGLLHETVNAILHRDDWKKVIKVPLAILPTGSGNGLAFTLIRQNHPDLDNLEDAIQLCLEQAVSGETLLSDLVKITYNRDKVVWSFLSIGWGLMADIDIDSEWLRGLGEYRFTIYGLLRAVTSRSYRGKLSYKMALLDNASSAELDNLKSTISHESNRTKSIFEQMIQSDEHWIHIEDSFACLYAVHQSYISRVTKFAPKSTLTDQTIYLTYIRGNLSICRVIEFLLAIEDGSHDKLPYVKVIPVSEFIFQPLEGSRVVVDGEVISWNLNDGPLQARVIPKIMRISWK